MVSQEEIRDLISKAKANGAIVNVGFDRMVKKLEGRDIVSSIQVIGLKGFGPYPVGPIAFAERMRELFVDTTGEST